MCSCSLAFGTGVIVLTVLISITTLFYTSSAKHWWSAILAPHICGVDPLTEPMLFTINAKYMYLSHDFDVEWEKLMPPNGGFIEQPDNEGIITKYGIGMFHQLHCLIMIRTEIQRLMHVEQSHHGRRGGKSEPDGEALHEKYHWMHCIDYIRQVRGSLMLHPSQAKKTHFSDIGNQGILCAADATLESPEEGPNGTLSVTGNMVNHTCRSSERLYGLIGKSGPQPPSRQDHHQEPDEEKKDSRL